MPGTPDLFGRAVAILAFLTAFYALAARERKTPYITNSLYSVLYLILSTLILYLVSASLQKQFPEASRWLSTGASSLFFASVIVVGYRIRKLQNRHTHFRDDNLIRNTVLFRKAKSLWRSIRRSPTYEHNPATFGRPLIDSLESCPLLPREAIERTFTLRMPGNSPSLFLHVESLTEADSVLLELSARFLQQGCLIQYTTCVRHPLEFIKQLQKLCPDRNLDWQKVSSSVVTVDAYTPHFGFTDSILAEARKRLAEIGIISIISAATYAGVHTAAAKAFNVHKKRRGSDPARRPTLVIYEGTHALSDLESVEQYKIFVRHVLPSERLWGGMFTVFLESALPEDLRNLLKSSVDISIVNKPATGD